MLKVTSTVELVVSHNYVGYNCEYIDFTDAQGNKVMLKMTAEQGRRLAESITDRYNNWLKDQAEKAKLASETE